MTLEFGCIVDRTQQLTERSFFVFLSGKIGRERAAAKRADWTLTTEGSASRSDAECVVAFGKNQPSRCALSQVAAAPMTLMSSGNALRSIFTCASVSVKEAYCATACVIPG